MIRYLKLSVFASKPEQIALSVAIAFIIGLTPFYSIGFIVLFFFICILRINLLVFFISTFIFSFVAYFSTPLLSKFGESLLLLDVLQDLWIYIYNNPIGRLTQFNNTVVMGGLSVSALLCIPVYYITIRFVNFIGAHIQLREKTSIESG